MVYEDVNDNNKIVGIAVKIIYIKLIILLKI
jgi:hypothetical protein